MRLDLTFDTGCGLCPMTVQNYGFKSFKLFGKHHFWDFLEKLLDDQLEKSNDGSFSVEKQSAKYNLCRAVAIIADIKLMEKNNGAPPRSNALSESQP